MVGLSGFEPLTSRLSGVRSNQLSYGPMPGTRSAVGPLNAEYGVCYGPHLYARPSGRALERAGTVTP